MADYFTNFSLIMPLPTEAAQRYALQLAQQASEIQTTEQIPEDFPADLHEVIEDWWFEIAADSPSDGWGVWLHSSSGAIDAVCAFIQHLLQRFDPTGHVGFEWSNDCSKPRTDAYGGGAALITAKRIQSIDTGQWLHRKVISLQNQTRGETRRRST